MVSAARTPAPAPTDSASGDRLTPDPCPLTLSSDPLTPLDQDLLTHIFTGQGQPLTLALSRGMSLADFLAWHERPEIVKAIASFDAIQDHAARRTIITELEVLVRTTPDLIEKRRAAATLLRALNPTRPRIAALQSAAGADTSPRSPRATREDPDDLTAQVVALLSKRGKIDRDAFNTLADKLEAEDDAEDDQDLDNEADEDSGDSDDDNSAANQPNQSNRSYESNRPYLSNASKPTPRPKSFQEAANLRESRAIPQRLPDNTDHLPKPSKDLTHKQVIETCMTALKNNDSQDSGVKTLWNFGSTNRYVNIRYPHYDHFTQVLHDGPLQHLLNHDSYTIPEQFIEGGYFGPTCLIHWFHIFVTKGGIERQFEIGVCRVKDEPDLPLHVATLAPPYSTRPFRPKPG